MAAKQPLRPLPTGLRLAEHPRWFERLGLGGVAAVPRPIDDLQLAVGMLDERGQALDPVAVVGVEHAVDVAHLGVVDVAADHAVDAAPARLACQRASKSQM